MTKEELKVLYKDVEDARQQEEIFAFSPRTFETDLGWRIAHLEHEKASSIYRTAVDLYLKEEFGLTD